MQLDLFNQETSEPVCRGFIALEEVLEAYYLCRKNKRNTAKTLAFEVDCKTKVYELWHSINDGRQHDYKPNRNISAGLLKRFVVKFCLRPETELRAYLSDYYRQILQTLEPERPGKNKERRRILRGTERHNHEKNYRRAL